MTKDEAVSVVNKFLKASCQDDIEQSDGDTCYWSIFLSQPNRVHYWIAIDSEIISVTANFGLLSQSSDSRTLLWLLEANIKLENGLWFGVQLQSLVVLGFNRELSRIDSAAFNICLRDVLQKAKQISENFCERGLSIEPLPSFWFSEKASQ